MISVPMRLSAQICKPMTLNDIGSELIVKLGALAGGRWSGTGEKHLTKVHDNANTLGSPTEHHRDIMSR